MCACSVGCTQAMVTQRNNDEIFGRDPVTLEQMTDPYIAPCGHTYDLGTIDALLASTPEELPLICPIDRKIINVDRLVPNLLAKEALERLNRGGEVLSGRVQSGGCQQDGELTRLLQGLTRRIEEQELRDIQLSKNIANLTTEVRELRQQISNVARMSLKDKILLALGPFVFYNRHLNKIMHRGLPPPPN